MLQGNELFAVHPVMLVMPWIPVIRGRKHITISRIPTHTMVVH